MSDAACKSCAVKPKCSKGCRSTPFSCAGMLLPLAYAPTAASAAPYTNSLLLECVVTALVHASTVINVRLYPQSESRMSTAGVMVSFMTWSPMWPSDFVRILVVTTDGGATGTFELQHRPQNGTWARAAEPVPIRIGYSDTCTCYVFFTTTSSGPCDPIAPVCAIGLRTHTGDAPVEPIMPTPCVLPCTAIIVADVAPGDTAVWFTGHIGQATQNCSVPGAWANAWTLIKWSAAWASTAALADLSADIETVENALMIRLLPGQLMPVAFRAYDYELAPTTPGEAAFVVTRRIPPLTTVYIWANAWADMDVLSVVTPPWWWVWTSPASCLEPGFVLTLSGLGAPFSPHASTGTLAASDTVTLVSVTALTLFSLDLRPKAWPITGIYTCAYDSSLPDELVIGDSIRGVPWPLTPSIVQLPTCSRISDWTCERFEIACAPVQRWSCQAPPMFAACARRECTTCNCCKPADATAVSYRLRGV